jgi:beta-glucosidase
MQKYIQDRYPDVQIIVTENGWGDPDVADKESMIIDIDRCNYYREYIGNMSLAVHEDGVNIGGYFAWSIMDNFEWSDGYTTRFGLTYVDYDTQERTTKLSYRWF